jgi:hypothetical protein
MGYDIVGDVHGCADKLTTLLKQLGYATATASTGTLNSGRSSSSAT